MYSIVVFNFSHQNTRCVVEEMFVTSNLGKPAVEHQTVVDGTEGTCGHLRAPARNYYSPWPLRLSSLYQLQALVSNCALLPSLTPAVFPIG